MVVGGKVVVGGNLMVVVEEGALVTLGSKHKNGFRFVQKMDSGFLITLSGLHCVFRVGDISF